MASARILLGLFGVAICVLGLVVAWTLNQVAGMVLLLVGGFVLLVLLIPIILSAML